MKDLAKNLSSQLADVDAFVEEYNNRMEDLEEQLKQAILDGDEEAINNIQKTMEQEAINFQKGLSGKTSKLRENGKQIASELIKSYVPQFQGRDLSSITNEEWQHASDDLEAAIHKIDDEISKTTDEKQKEVLEKRKQDLESQKTGFDITKEYINTFLEKIGLNPGEGEYGKDYKSTFDPVLSALNDDFDWFNEQVNDRIENAVSGLEKVDIYTDAIPKLQEKYEKALYLNAGKESETSKKIAKQIEENQKGITEAYKENHQAIIQEYEDMNDELQDYIDLLDEDSPTYLADKADLLSRQAAVLRSEMAANATEIERVRKALEKDPANQGLLDYLKDLQKEARQYQKDQKSIEDGFEELNNKTKEAVDNAEDLIKSGITEQLDEIEDGLQKEADAAEKNADAIKKANDDKRDALQAYLDMLEKIWDAEDKENERQKKLQQRSEIVQERNRYLTAGATGDLEALSSAQDKQKELEELDEELKEDAIEAWRQAIRDAIQDQIDQLDNIDDELDKQTEVLRDQLEAFQDLRKTLEDDPEQMAALVADILAKGTGTAIGQTFDMSNMGTLADKASGEYYKATYDPTITQKALQQGLQYYNPITGGYTKITQTDYGMIIADSLKDERKKMRDWLTQLGYTVESYDKDSYKTTISKDGKTYTLDPEAVLGNMESDYYHYATGEQMQQVLANAGINTSLEEILGLPADTAAESMDKVSVSADNTAESLDKMNSALTGATTTSTLAKTTGGTTAATPTSATSSGGTIATIKALPSLVQTLLDSNDTVVSNIAKGMLDSIDVDAKEASKGININNNVDINIGDTTIRIDGNADNNTLIKMERMIDSKIKDFSNKLVGKMGANPSANRKKF